MENKLRFEIREKTNEVKELKDRLASALKRLQVSRQTLHKPCLNPEPIRSKTSQGPPLICSQTSTDLFEAESPISIISQTPKR